MCSTVESPTQNVAKAQMSPREGTVLAVTTEWHDPKTLLEAFDAATAKAPTGQ